MNLQHFNDKQLETKLKISENSLKLEETTVNILNEEIRQIKQELFRRKGKEYSKLSQNAELEKYLGSNHPVFDKSTNDMEDEHLNECLESEGLDNSGILDKTFDKVSGDSSVYLKEYDKEKEEFTGKVMKFTFKNDTIYCRRQEK